MNLVFKELRYKNILSTGNTFTVIPLDQSKTTLVVGTNGAGKSTMLDALTFCLYGKPFRKLTKNRLINSKNEKKLLVEVDFVIGDKKFTIRRGIKPNLLEIIRDGEILDKEATVADQQKIIESTIIRMNYKTFCQMVILGKTNYVAFMGLSAEDRRKFIENLLDIEIFSRMNKLLKDKWIKDNKVAIQDEERKRDITSANIDGLKEKRDAVSTIQENEINKLKKKALEEKEKMQSKQNEYAKNEEEINSLQSTIEDKKRVFLKYDKIKEIQADLKAKLKSAKQPVNFLETNDTCPTCKQDIDGEFKVSAIEDANKSIEKIQKDIDKSEEIYEQLYDRKEEIKEVEEKISSIKSSNDNIKYSINMSKQTLLGIKKDVEDMKENREFDDAEKLEELEKELLTQKKNLVKLYELKGIYATSLDLLKDTGIKSQIIKQYVPLINKVINAYLSEMDLFINFEFDENFDETIKSRNRDDFKYENFSEGEKLRIDLALLFTWRDISKMRNPVTANLLMMDEILDSSLDEIGINDFMKIIGKFTDSNLFIISPKGEELFANFETTLRFDKIKGYSRLI